MPSCLLVTKPFLPPQEADACLACANQQDDHNAAHHITLPTDTKPDEQAEWFKTALMETFTDGGLKRMVIAGGDGTIQIILAGLIAYSEKFDTEPAPIITLIPAGTGNLLAENIGIPLDPTLAASLPNEDCTVNVPIAIAKAHHKTHYFCLLAGLGATSQVMLETKPELKRWLGIWAYLVMGVRVFLGSAHRRYTIVTPDGEQTVSAKSMIISHSATYLGPFMPQIATANAHQRQFTISIIAFPSIKDHWRLFRDLFRPKAADSFHSTVNVICTNEASIKCAHKKQPMQLDGNLIGFLPVHIGFTPHSLTLHVPKDAAAYLQQARKTIAPRQCVDRS